MLSSAEAGKCLRKIVAHWNEDEEELKKRGWSNCKDALHGPVGRKNS